MREILFRAKRTDNGEWVEGFYEYSYMYDSLRECHRIIWVDKPTRTNYLAEVDPETVGQYTGLTTPSGKIFEHDIVTAKFKSNGARFNFTVKYSDEKGCYVFDNGHIKVLLNDIRSVRVIGNIHDNPELLT